MSMKTIIFKRNIYYNYVIFFLSPLPESIVRIPLFFPVLYSVISYSSYTLFKMQYFASSLNRIVLTDTYLSFCLIAKFVSKMLFLKLRLKIYQQRVHSIKVLLYITSHKHFFFNFDIVLILNTNSNKI